MRRIILRKGIMMKKKILTLIVLAVLGLAVQVHAAYYIAGDFNGWTATGNLMTETSGGVWSATLSGITPGRHEFKVTNGTWTLSYPTANSWFYPDASGNVTITFNTNSVSDGWQPAQNRIRLSTDPGVWTIAGNFGPLGSPLYWNSANPDMAMTSMGGGIYMFSKIFSTSSYQFKPVVTGTWDSIAADARSVGTANMNLTTTANFEAINIFVDSFGGTVSVGGEPANVPHDPTPAKSQTGVLISGLAFSWSVGRDPNGVIDPNLIAHKLYMSNGSTTTEPNLVYVATITGWNTGTLRASYTPGTPLNKDRRYFWRVDMVRNDAVELKGPVWTFNTELTTPQITAGPDYQVVPAGATAVFSVTVASPSTPTYQWYKYVDGISDIKLSNAGDISGATAASLSIANVDLTDEGAYYCIVNNSSGTPVSSSKALLGVKRRIAFWDFESGNANSTVAGSPASILVGDPVFVAAGGVGGSDAMVFDADTGAGDMLYTDPNFSAYFDICNFNLTVACWIKSTSTVDWVPLVARNGEESGWQLRQSGFVNNAGTTDRPCLTTRGTTGNENGTPANRTVYDGNWHYVVATYDGAIKKVYIDGVVSRFYSTDNGSVANEGDAVTGLISSSGSPIAIAGRVRGNLVEGLTIEDWNITAGTYDNVEIYNYALDAATIAQTYADITDTAVCSGIQAYDLNGDCKVNLNDLTLLASQWLSDINVQP
jgi:hypothetical protein